jgi:hypothetical protein
VSQAEYCGYCKEGPTCEDQIEGKYVQWQTRRLISGSFRVTSSLRVASYARSKAETTRHGKSDWNQMRKTYQYCFFRRRGIPIIHERFLGRIYTDSMTRPSPSRSFPWPIPGIRLKLRYPRHSFKPRISSRPRRSGRKLISSLQTIKGIAFARFNLYMRPVKVIAHLILLIIRRGESEIIILITSKVGREIHRKHRIEGCHAGDIIHILFGELDAQNFQHGPDVLAYI